MIFSRLRFQGAARDFQLAHDHHEHCHDHHHHEHHDGCCGEDCHHDARPANAKKRAARALADSCLRVLQKSWAWILLGVALAAALEACVPLQSLSELIGGHTVLSGLIAALIGFPIHSDIFSIAPVLLPAHGSVRHRGDDLRSGRDGHLGARRHHARSGAQTKSGGPSMPGCSLC